ncbi:MAG: nucleoside/nucleotide kinase family protein [Betaproteobacteria bacterium HGW-Betaproteobacteria-18]|nr:MAG: nucleoside/nucleotide kinase family protein [Betaproteobacteria bacterium HGW-Betaproteobacteria-18]
MKTPALPDEHLPPPICQQRIAQLLASGERKILGLVAPPGAGKSTLAETLMALYPQHMQGVPMDGFHLANSELERLGRHQRKGAPDTFDAAGFVNLLRRLKNQSSAETIYAPEFRRDMEEPIAGAIAIAPDTPLVITEGNYLLLDDWPWVQVREVVDEIWYLDVPNELRHQRLLARHMRFGRSRAQALDWIANTDEPNALRISQSRQYADVCVPWA